MCGRYVLAMRPSQVQRYLEERDLPVHDAPDDEGEGAPRQSYNFAPGYYGAVYRADVPDRGAPAEPHSPSHPEETSEGAIEESSGGAPAQAAAAKESPRYRLQSMKWGLIPSWTKRSPNYASMLKTINCRSDSLSGSGGMWSSMKGRKRCIVVADGFYEWLKVGPKERVPHYIKRKDGQPMLFAGLWDCVKFEDSDERLYTYTIITVDSSPRLKFLHDRMPAILEPSASELAKWIDPSRNTWSRELQDVLRPSSAELEVYPVSKDVGKVGNDSPSFVIPVASRENKGNIANFFANAKKKGDAPSSSPGVEKEIKEESDGEEVKGEVGASITAAKRGASPPDRTAEPPSKMPATSPRKKISATSNGTKAPARQGPEGSQKITSFFTKKA